MSAAAGGQPPQQPPGGDPTRGFPSDKPMFNSWTENKKIKTCKCTVCDGRVRASSQKCDGCGRHVCSDCLDPSSDKDNYYKAAAKNRIEVGCWACNWRSNMNPAFANRKPAPEVRTDEERRARASKALGARRKATAQASGSRSAAVESAEDAEDAVIPGHRSAYRHGAGEASDMEAQAAPVQPGPEHIERKRSFEAMLDESEVVASSSAAKASKKSAEQSAPRTFDKPFTKPTTSTSSSANTELPHRSDYSNITLPSATMSATEPRAPHELLDGADTVIVGAGVVGMFIAYEYATKLKEHGIKHSITVVDINGADGGTLPLASGMCAGDLGSSGMPGLWNRKILDTAHSYWGDLVSNADFAQSDIFLNAPTLKLSTNAAVNNTQQIDIPSWYHGQNGTLLADAESFGRVDPQALGSWLFKQCKQLGVEFGWGHYVYNVEYSLHSFLKAVYVRSVADPDKEKKLDCHNLVLAAGPFTTGIFKSLYNEAAVELDNDVQRVHRLNVLLKDVAEEDHTVVRLPTAAKDTKRFEDEVKMSLMPGIKSVTVSAISSKTRPLNLFTKLATTPNLSRDDILRSLAADFLNHDDFDVMNKKAHPGKAHCSVISTANDGNPIIDKVPPSALGRLAFKNEDACPMGVWLCYGFGAYGTTLAPGAARILVERMMFEEEAGLTDYDFSLPAYLKQTVDEYLARKRQRLE